MESNGRVCLFSQHLETEGSGLSHVLDLPDLYNKTLSQKLLSEWMEKLW